MRSNFQEILCQHKLILVSGFWMLDIFDATI